MMSNFKQFLINAKKNKNDEFYTQLKDIENEMKYYKKHFENKIIFLNCDDPTTSQFYMYFSLYFDHLKLKKVIATHYDKDRPTYKLELTRSMIANQRPPKKTPWKKCNGDFRSEQCIELLKESDIVCTNPPFSLFREYISQLIKYDKKFLIIGHQNAISYKEIFPFFKENKIWLGCSISSGGLRFYAPNYQLHSSTADKNNGMVEVSGVRWFTKLENKRRNEAFILYQKYSPEKYPHYDNYDAINVDKTKDIPVDWDGKMGVPISFMNKYNPKQFKIIALGIEEHNFKPNKKYKKFYDPITKKPTNHMRKWLLYVKDKNGPYLTEDGYRIRKTYARIIIQRIS